MTRTRRQRRQRRIKQLVILVFVLIVGLAVWSYFSDGEPVGGVNNTAVIGLEVGADNNDPPNPDVTTGVGRKDSDAAAGVGAAMDTNLELTSAIQDPPPQYLPTPVVTPDPVVEPDPEPTPVVTPAPEIQLTQSLTPTANPYGDAQPEASRLATAAEQMVLNGQLVDARDMLAQALNNEPGSIDASSWRAQLGKINDTLIFSPSLKFIEDDPLAEAYVVKPGESLSVIAGRHNIPWQFIARINNIKSARSLRAGQRIKLINGPFRAVVHKLAFRLDIYLGDVFIRSFRVGLGEHDSTPPGAYQVRKGSKLENPEWVNPRTGDRFLADNPENPLGEYWVGLKGVDENTKFNEGYGIHGTIYPETIGTEASMGCVRMLAPDIEVVYQMLSETSYVDIID